MGWLLGPVGVPTGRADFTTERERGKERPRDQLRTELPTDSLGELGLVRGEWPPKQCEVLEGAFVIGLEQGALPLRPSAEHGAQMQEFTEPKPASESADLMDIRGLERGT